MQHLQGGFGSMAQLVLGIGMSHSPMMAIDGEHWSEFTKVDYRNVNLYDETGKHVTYDELSKQRGERYLQVAESGYLAKQSEVMKKAFKRLKADVAELAPDVLIVIANDHPGEFLEFSNVPALAVFYGDKVISATFENDKVKNRRQQLSSPEIMQQMATGMGMETNHVWPGSSKVGKHLIENLIDQGFDVGALKEVEDPFRNGHGHGFGMVVKELMDRENLIPMVPIYLNAWPPNEISPSRCYDLGRALRRAIETIPDNLRVAVVASGGLSHFVTDADLDEHVLAALRSRSEQDLRNLPKYRLKSGNSEIRNWVILAAAVEHLQMDWDEYIPVFRTSSGTGLGMTFARWS
jgi:aromatic ring-opening dioxygenase catalytic subunit (LigB family)